MVAYAHHGAGRGPEGSMQWWAKYRLFFLVAFFLVVFPTSAPAATPNPLCTGKNYTLRCLKENFRELYMTDYGRFSTILRIAERKARRCDSLANTTRFLAVARFIKGNAEVGEYFGEVTEKLCTNKPRCFLDALAQVDEESRAVIVRDLRTPTFLEETAIEMVFRRYRDNPKYKAIMDLYFAR
jgi:hypothetical protein